ncbi:MAG: peptidoglycan-binding domain-containing protein, partial [Pseudomonadota bacterium]
MAQDLPTLRWGSTGRYVEILQNVLNDCTFRLKIPLEPDGVFGRLTHDAVILFQEENSPLVVDGIVGPNTWGVLNELYQELLKDAIHKVPENCHYPVQHTPVDCGYFSHYCLSAVNKARSLSVHFTEKQVLDARDDWGKAAGRSDPGYLAPEFSVDFLNYLGCHGYHWTFANEYFKPSFGLKGSAKYLVDRVGMSGVALVLNTFATGAMAHWIAVPSWKTVKNQTFFFVYDSSSTLPKIQRKDGFPAGNTMCWIDYVRLMN